MDRQILTKEDVKSVQLEVLQEFHNFCINHNIKYSLCAGTLLGSVRHRGFIPWDDDIDVMMPRKEYKKLLDLFSSDKCTLYTYDKYQTYMFPFAKLCNNETLLIENSVYKTDLGVNIDIFPLDFFPASIHESKKWSNRLKWLKNIKALKNLTISHERAVWKNCVIVIARMILSPIPMKYIVRKIDLTAQKYADRNSGFLGNMTSGYGMKERNPIAKELIDVIFEGRKYKAIDNYDVYLGGLFGNYMKLPPEEQRVSHHSFKAYWK